MDRRERTGEMTAALQMFGEGLQAQLWTAMPGIIQTFDPVKKTCTIQPAIQAQVQHQDGSLEWVTLPLLLDCPVQFSGGGGATLTFPLKPGDECLVVFASRCIDAWWQSGGVQIQAELRMHDLSDGFCVPGVSSVPKVQPSISTTHAEFRSDDGTAKVRINVTTKDVDVITPGNLTATATGNAQVTAGGTAGITSTGDMTLTAPNIKIVGALSVNGAPFLGHKHSGVTVGAGQTGGVV